MCVSSYNIPHQTHVPQPTIPASYHKVCATKENNTVCHLTTVLLLRFVLCTVVGRDSSVGIATRYGLDGPGIESR